MREASIRAEALSRKKIRSITSEIRDLLGLKNTMFFDIIRFLDLIMPQIDEEFTCNIIEKEDMAEEGLTFPDLKCIEIREDIYEGAIKGNSRDRFTIAHEIGHYLLHKQSRIGYARLSTGENIPRYCDPEWQANTFAAELLVPSNLIKNKSSSYVVKECAVSLIVANIQKKYV